MNIREKGQAIREYSGTKVCPRCEQEGDIKSMFGYRKLSEGRIRPQSQCKACRNKRPVKKRATTGFTTLTDGDIVSYDVARFMGVL